MKIAISCLLALFSFSSAKGQHVWNFTLKDVHNNISSFEELKGDKLTLIDFWTTWCKPCQKSIPQLNEIYDTYQNKGVQIIGVNCDGPRSVAKVAPYTMAHQIKYPVLVDINSELMNDLNLANFPTLIIVNAKGNIEFVHEGFVTGDEKLIKQKIDNYLSN